jgi:hypothetical protein
VRHEFWLLPGERLGHCRTDVVGDDRDMPEAEPTRKASDIRCDDASVIALLRGQVGLVRIGKAAKVRDNHVIVLS